MVPQNCPFKGQRGRGAGPSGVLQLPFGCFEPSVSEEIGAPPSDGKGAKIKDERREGGATEELHQPLLLWYIRSVPSTDI